MHPRFVATGLAAATVLGTAVVLRRQEQASQQEVDKKMAQIEREALNYSSSSSGREHTREPDQEGVGQGNDAVDSSQEVASAPQAATGAETTEIESRTDQSSAVPPPPSAATGNTRERLMGLRTLLSSLQGCDRVCVDSIMGPFQMNAGTEEEVPVVCFQFRMSHFTCKAYLAHGTQDEGSQHLKLQTTFEDNRRSLGEEQRYFIANEWNATKRYTRLKCGSGGTGRSCVFTLEYDVLVPADTPHSWGLLLLSQTLRMWYTSMVACVMHIVEPRDVPFATHDMIMRNTLSVAVREEDTCLLQQSCPICFENFRVGEKVRRLPCMHCFHVVGADSDASQGHHCNIDRHLVRDKQCPVCKTPVDFMDRLDKNAPQSKHVEGEAMAISEAGENASADALAVTQVTTVHPASDAVESNPIAPVVSAATVEGDAMVHHAVTVAAPTSRSVAAVARGAAEQGIAAVAEVAAAAARIAPVSNQDGGQGQSGLPAQAAELERAVRSLQSRWMQIQDVVAGMQQMLQYIEESQSMMSATRVEQQQGERTEADADSAEAVANESIQPATESSGEAPVEASQGTTDTQLPAEEDTEVEQQEVAADDNEQTPQVQVEPIAEEVIPQALESNSDALKAHDQVSSADPVAEDARTQSADSNVEIQAEAVGNVAEDVRVTPQAAAIQARRVLQDVQASVLSRLSQTPSRESTLAQAAPCTSERWVPFTEAEKMCMANVWKWRRASMMARMGLTHSPVAQQSNGTENSAPS
jgi:hypothetical protein